MPTKRYKSAKRYKLSNLTAAQLTDLLHKHNSKTSAVAAELGVTVQALNRWIRLNNCQWAVVECVAQPEARAGK